MTELETLQAIAQVAAPLVAAAAATASWLSALASRRTAGSADETARRSIEALGRATAPALRIDMPDYPATQRDAGRGPVPVTLFIVNESPNRGVILSSTLSRPDSVLLTAVRPSMPEEIGPIIGIGEQANHMHVYLGRMPRLLPNAQTDEDSTASITLDVGFSDVGRAVRWRHRSRWAECFRVDPSNGDPVYSYMQVGRAEIEIIGEEPQPARPPGVIRRAWYWLW